LVKKINGVYQFNITHGPGGQSKSWVADLKSGTGKLTVGNADKADCTITIADKDFVDLMGGKLNAQNAFVQGKLKIKGDMRLATKLEAIVKGGSKL